MSFESRDYGERRETAAHDSHSAEFVIREGSSADRAESGRRGCLVLAATTTGHRGTFRQAFLLNGAPPVPRIWMMVSVPWKGKAKAGLSEWQHDRSELGRGCCACSSSSSSSSGSGSRPCTKKTPLTNRRAKNKEGALASRAVGSVRDAGSADAGTREGRFSPTCWEAAQFSGEVPVLAAASFVFVVVAVVVATAVTTAATVLRDYVDVFVNCRPPAYDVIGGRL
uniref:Uncharacterized protein n=1 Tax=Anopheles dirus TaxID=7168 RepID=A0A182NXI1_9DIPT